MNHCSTSLPFCKASLFPLDFPPELSSLEFSPADNYSTLLILSRKLTSPFTVGSVEMDRVPVIFEIIGQVCPDNCIFMTDSSHASLNLQDNESLSVATCWIEPRIRGVAPEVQWYHYLVSLQTLANKLRTQYPDLQTYNLYKENPENTLKKIKVHRVMDLYKVGGLYFFHSFMFQAHSAAYNFLPSIGTSSPNIRRSHSAGFTKS